jgi:hypothetical protein
MGLKPSLWDAASARVRAYGREAHAPAVNSNARAELDAGPRYTWTPGTVQGSS